VLRDIGFTPRTAGGFTMIYFVVPLLAQVVFGEEHSRVNATSAHRSVD
jgi:hypothetical protein